MSRRPPALLRRLDLRVELSPSPADLAALDDGLESATLAAVGGGATQPLVVLARDRSGRLVGGVQGWSWGGCAELASVWVADELRGNGLGHALLLAAEREARSRGCSQVMVFAHADQPPSLYTGSGYAVVGEVVGYPAGSTAFWLCKPIDGRRGLRTSQVVQAAIWAVVVGVVVQEMADALRSARRRMSHTLSEWWEAVERRERQDARRTRVAYLAARTRPSRRRAGPWPA